MSEHATAFEQQAIANIAAEMPISVVFMRHTPGRIGTRTSTVSPKNYAEIDEAVHALTNPPFVQEFITTHAGILQLAMSGFVEHDRGYLVMLAGSHTLPKKPEEMRSWVTMMASAWAGLVADHISMLNSTGTVAAPSMEYLAARFSTDETNLWLLAEEAGEVVRGCGKIGRWGYDHVHQVTGESGMRLLEAEVGDFLGIVDIMIARGHFTVEALEAAKQAKLKRLEDWYEAPWTPADMAPAWAAPETEGLSTPPATPSPTTHSAKELIESGYLAKIVLGDAGLPAPPKGFQWQALGDPQRCETGRPRSWMPSETRLKPKPKFNVTRLDGREYQGWLMEEPALPCGRMRMALDTDQMIWVQTLNQELHEVTPPGTPPTQSPARIANKAYWKERADTMARSLFPFEELPVAESSGLAAGITQSYSHVSSAEPAEEWSSTEELPRTPEGYLDWKALDGDLATVKQGVGGLLTVEVTKNGRMRVFTGIVASPITISINPTSPCIP